MQYMSNILDKAMKLLKLAKFLIARDTSREATKSAIDQNKPKTHKYVIITRDISWEATESTIDQSKPKTHKHGAPFFASQGQVNFDARDCRYTSFVGLFPLLSRTLPLVKVEEVSETINSQNFTIQNSVLFSGPLATTSFSTNAKLEV
ncbi:hypothetical protein ACSBR2_016198 [Camellia fascicularis]